MASSKSSPNDWNLLGTREEWSYLGHLKIIALDVHDCKNVQFHIFFWLHKPCSHYSVQSTVHRLHCSLLPQIGMGQISARRTWVIKRESLAWGAWVSNWISSMLRNLLQHQKSYSHWEQTRRCRQVRKWRRAVEKQQNMFVFSWHPDTKATVKYGRGSIIVCGCMSAAWGSGFQFPAR